MITELLRKVSQYFKIITFANMGLACQELAEVGADFILDVQTEMSPKALLPEMSTSSPTL